MTTYREEYKSFMEHVASGTPVAALDVGKLIAKLAQYFSEAVQLAASSERQYNNKLALLEQSTDENTGKPLSSTKAEALAKATDEYSSYIIDKGNVVSIEVMINALKSLQKGVMNEYSHMGE